MLGVIGQGLRIGDHNEDFIEFAGILQGYALLQGADIMAHMQPTGGAVAGQDNLFHEYCFLSAYETWREGRTDASIIGGEVLNVNLFRMGGR